MANTIQLKRNSTASETPSASDLAVGELAVNTADAKLFTKHTDNSIKEMSGIPSDGILNLTNTGSRSEVRLYCETTNQHYSAIKAATHAALQGVGNVTLTLPAATGTLLSTTSNLSDLANVSDTSPNSGEVLKWNGSKWEAAADATGSGGGSSTLSGLSDTNISSPSSGHIIQWSGDQWVNETLSTNADTVDGKHISVVSELPESTNSNTIYFITS